MLAGGSVYILVLDFPKCFHCKIVIIPLFTALHNLHFLDFVCVCVCVLCLSGAGKDCPKESSWDKKGSFHTSILHILSEDMAEFNCLSVCWFCLLMMSGLCMSSSIEQLGTTSPFHECTCNKETRQGQTEKVHKLGSSWQEKAHRSAPSSKVWRKTRT